MPLGDSITKGAVDPAPSLSGYRARLFDLLNAAHVKYLFVGCTDVNSCPAMKAAGQQFHNGYGSWRIDSLRANLDGNQQPDGDPNMGGYWMVGGTGALRQPVFPDIVLLLAGTNDLGAGATEPVLENRMTDLLAWFQTNRPKSQMFVGTVPPRGLDKPGNGTYNPAIVVFNGWLAQKIPTLGRQFHLVDIHGLFMDGTGKVKGSDSPDGFFEGWHSSFSQWLRRNGRCVVPSHPTFSPAKVGGASSSPASKGF